MNIKRAKNEIKDTIEAYLKKDELGEYQIPAIYQRPILLIGAPGIGKTQIMEQIARECKIGLVSYTITHHTRQSAIGLPFIEHKNYQGEEFAVTEYTMSEIIASVYEKIEKTGNKEGILFLDEINCVSETLAPTMLQFLQCKMFGNQKVPEGWIIVTAGNPPQYNKSVRDFDVVTLDRIKKMLVEPDFGVWKEYAYRQQIHPAILSYLELRRENFFRIENTVDGKLFVTARGWEDLSRFLAVSEVIGKQIDREVIAQYVQFPAVAKDFANYLELYYKYKQDYGIEDILQGKYSSLTMQKMRLAPFDERLSVVGLLNGKLGDQFAECYREQGCAKRLFEILSKWKQQTEEITFTEIFQQAQREYQQKIKSEQLSQEQRKIEKKVLDILEEYQRALDTKKSNQEAFEQVREWFACREDEREIMSEDIAKQLDHVFEFLELTFGEDQEMVAFITELNANYYAVWYITEYGCDAYYRHNKGLLFDNRQKEIVGQMEDVDRLLQEGAGGIQ